ncbi:MAG: hypothetical protein ACTHQQ_02940 [Solirubrobacteraceae bacterium]
MPAPFEEWLERPLEFDIGEGLPQEGQIPVAMQQLGGLTEHRDQHGSRGDPGAGSNLPASKVPQVGSCLERGLGAAERQRMSVMGVAGASAG